MRDFLPEIEHPATRIGMTPDLYDALARVADDLASGKIRHHRFPRGLSGGMDLSTIPPGHSFNMEYWNRSESCGTVLCIAGWVEAMIGAERHLNLLYGYCDLSLELRWQLEKLYFPFNSWVKAPCAWNDITPNQAAAAIRGLLATGKTDWRKAISEKQSRLGESPNQDR